MEEVKVKLEELAKTRAGGPLQTNWTDAATLDPVSEWASEILGEGILKSPLPGVIQKAGPTMWRRANKKQLFFKSKVSNAKGLTWGTGVVDLRGGSLYQTELDLDTLYIDPVEFRTYTPVAWESLDEVDMIPLEGYVRSQLGLQAGYKIANVIYTAFDDGVIGTDYLMDVAASAFVYTDTTTEVDWGDSYSVDNFKAQIEQLIAGGYNPTDCVVPPAMYSDLFNESQFVNAAQYGAQNTAIIEGVIPRFMGVDTYLDTYMPNDSGDKDWGVVFDRDLFMGAVVANDARIDVTTRYQTGEVEFYLALKLGAKVINEGAACVAYT